MMFVGDSSSGPTSLPSTIVPAPTTLSSPSFTGVTFSSSSPSRYNGIDSTLGLLAVASTLILYFSGVLT